MDVAASQSRCIAFIFRLCQINYCSVEVPCALHDVSGRTASLIPNFDTRRKCKLHALAALSPVKPPPVHTE